MTKLGGFGMPGNGSIDQTSEREIIWGGDGSKGLCLWQNGHYDGAMRDAGNSGQTSVVRPGLVLGRKTSDGLLYEYDPAQTDGTQNVVGILDHELWMLDPHANNADRFTRMLVRAPIRAGRVHIKGVNLDGAAGEYAARRQLVAAGFQFDDDPFSYKAGRGQRVKTVTAAPTIVGDDNGTLFISNASGSLTFTLPTIQPGLEYEFLNAVNQTMVVISATPDDVVFGNDASGDSITFGTSSEKIGARIQVRSVYAAGTLKWLMEQVQTPFGTGLTGGLTYTLAS